jgi:hypothetical protein
MVCPRDDRFARFKWLAQRIQHLRRKLRKFVQKKNTEMRERNFAGPRAKTAADHRRHACRMMWVAERSLVRERPALDCTGDRLDHRDFEQFGRRERRQDGRQSCGKHRLAGARRTRHQKIMSTGCGDLERAFRALLSFDVFQIEWARRKLADLR